MNGQQRKEMNDFISQCDVIIIYQSKFSRYFRIIYKENQFNICISDHFGIYRTGYRQYVSKKKTASNAKLFAWELYKIQNIEKHL